MFPDSFADGTRKHLVHHTSFLRAQLSQCFSSFSRRVFAGFFFSFFVQDFCERIVGEGGIRVAVFFLEFFFGREEGMWRSR
jgi:hypothetical protein